MLTSLTPTSRAVLTIAAQVSSGSGTPFAMLPLHKGADGFMSDADFKKFYWPTFKATLLGLIEAGLVPFMLVEGGYNDRLEVIADSAPGGCP